MTNTDFWTIVVGFSIGYLVPLTLYKLVVWFNILTTPDTDDDIEGL
jgi:hypothetical protein